MASDRMFVLTRPDPATNTAIDLGLAIGDGLMQGEALTVAEGQLRDFQTRTAGAFEHEQYLKQLSALRDQLKVALSESAPEDGPSAAELAGQIKALRAANTIEAAPERTAKRKVTGEIPVTARILQRKESVEIEVQAMTGERAMVDRINRAAGRGR